MSRPYLWEGPLRDNGVLPALRRGLGQEPGSVPQMWPYYTRLNAAGHITAALWAEHLALTCFGVHQQGRAASVHVPGVSLGSALRRVRDAGRFSESALDERVRRFAVADQDDQIAHHLVGLVRLVAQDSSIRGFDYTRLCEELVRQRFENTAPGVRRRLGADYSRPDKKKD